MFPSAFYLAIIDFIMEKVITIFSACKNIYTCTGISVLCSWGKNHSLMISASFSFENHYFPRTELSDIATRFCVPKTHKQD